MQARAFQALHDFTAYCPEAQKRKAGVGTINSAILVDSGLGAYEDSFLISAHLLWLEMLAKNKFSLNSLVIIPFGKWFNTLETENMGC